MKVRITIRHLYNVCYPYYWTCDNAETGEVICTTDTHLESRFATADEAESDARDFLAAMRGEVVIQRKELGNNLAAPPIVIEVMEEVK